MRIFTFPLGPLETNCYLLTAEQEAVVIDPGGDPAKIVRVLKEKSLKLKAILNTHLHFDHVLGNAALAEQTGAPIYANKLDDFLRRPEMSGVVYGLPPTPPYSYEEIEEGSTQLLGQECRMFHTPGHTPGSISYYFPESAALFAGDVLFQRSVGRTDLPGGSSQTLRDSIQVKLFALPDETVVYPGHGPATTIGEEKRYNPFVGGI